MPLTVKTHPFLCYLKLGLFPWDVGVVFDLVQQVQNILVRMCIVNGSLYLLKVETNTCCNVCVVLIMSVLNSPAPAFKTAIVKLKLILYYFTRYNLVLDISLFINCEIIYQRHKLLQTR